MGNEAFEKRRRGIQLLFTIMFWMILVEVFGYVLFKAFYALGISTVDIFNLKDFILLLISLAFMLFSTRLASSGNIFAGIIGIIVATIQILFGGIVGQIIGVLLVIDSVLYVINYNKK